MVRFGLKCEGATFSHPTPIFIEHFHNIISGVGVWGCAYIFILYFLIHNLYFLIHLYKSVGVTVCIYVHIHLHECSECEKWKCAFMYTNKLKASVIFYIHLIHLANMPTTWIVLLTKKKSSNLDSLQKIMFIKWIGVFISSLFN